MPLVRNSKFTSAPGSGGVGFSILTLMITVALYSGSMPLMYTCCPRSSPEGDKDNADGNTKKEQLGREPDSKLGTAVE